MRNCLDVKGPSLDVYEVLPRGHKGRGVDLINKSARIVLWMVRFFAPQGRIATLTARSLLLSDNFRELSDFVDHGGQNRSDSFSSHPKNADEKAGEDGLKPQGDQRCSGHDESHRVGVIQVAETSQPPLPDSSQQ
jgi:hypothetical protein